MFINQDSDIKKQLLKLHCARYLSDNFKEEAIPVQIAIWNGEAHSLFGKIVAVCWKGKDDVYIWDDENILGSGYTTIINIDVK